MAIFLIVGGALVLAALIISANRYHVDWTGEMIPGVRTRDPRAGVRTKP